MLSLLKLKRQESENMNYFPAYIKMNNQKILLVGGGKVAFEKLSHLVNFTTNIAILAKSINRDVKTLAAQNDINTREKSYCKGDVAFFDIVIVAVDDLSLQEDIFQEARGKGILCNAVDSLDYCDFIFPSYIKKGDLIVSVSTSGASPAVAKYLRRYIEKMLPDGIELFLKEMREYRKRLPKGKPRMQFLDKLAKNYFKTKDERDE